VEWPPEFYRMRAGIDCPLCGDDRPAENEHGVRFFSGDVTDAYLQRAAMQRGYCVVLWRGRHVAEPTELDTAEATAYWLELLAVGRAVERHFEPVKVNYDTLGNSVPHLHTHVIPRYAEDPRPGWPFPFPQEPPGQRADAELRRDAAALAAILRPTA
jgi:diadenosine tetraphosphate (Ap4A) HIT family hydrolase